jgi:transposase
MNPTPHTWKEARRIQAWHLKPQGWPQRQMAAALGGSEGAVSQWVARARAVGPEALRRRPPPGAPRRRSPEPRARLPALWHRGPPAYGVRGDLGTHSRGAAMIRVACGGSSPPRHVGRLLAVMRWRPPQPARRARQRDDAASAPWRDDTWPALNKGRKPSSTRSCS